MNITEIENAGVNYCEGLKRFGNRKELYEKYLLKFFEDSSINDLAVCIQKEQYEEAFKCAHTLKGVSSNLSLTDVYACCCKLVEALRNRQFDNIAELYKSLENSYNVLKSALLNTK